MPLGQGWQPDTQVQGVTLPGVAPPGLGSNSISPAAIWGGDLFVYYLSAGLRYGDGLIADIAFARFDGTNWSVNNSVETQTGGTDSNTVSTSEY
jgi:hypothetical protein